MQQENYGKLLALNYGLYDLNDFEEIIDYIVNDSRKIISYQLALVYEVDLNITDTPTILSISGTLGQDIGVDFKNWLIDILSHIHNNFYNEMKDSIANKQFIKVIHKNDLDKKIQKLWVENLGQELLISNIYKSKSRIINFVAFNNNEFSQDSLLQLNFILRSYQQALKINLKDQPRKRTIIKNKSNLLKLLVILFTVSMFLPITPRVMAPAEIISEKNWDVNSPITGIVDDVLVEPSSNIKKNQKIITFDQLDLKNALRIKQQELKTLEADLNQARAEGFEDKEQRAKIFRLQQQLATKRQEINYAREQFNQSILRAPASGTVLFKDKNDLIGKPVTIGERLMRIADVNSSVIEIWLDVDDNLRLEKGNEITYYSNTSPFKPRSAKLLYYSYEAYVTPHKNIAFRLLAKLDDQYDDIIIGDHGKVKIYGQNKIFIGQFIFQRPMASLRQWFYGLI